MMDQDWMQQMERRMATNETFVKEIRENHLPHIKERLDWIYERMNRGQRPTWTTSFVLMFLSSLCVGLLVSRWMQL